MSGGPTRDKVARGAILLTVTRLLSRSFDLVTLIVLTRVLLPADFGLVAIALSVMQVTEAVLELSTGQAILQFRTVTRRHLDTAFTIALLRGAAIALILCAIALPLALFYDEPRLAALTCAMAIAPAIRGLRSPRLYLLIRHLRFGPEAASEFVGKVVSLAAAVSLALATGSYWAIAAGTIFNPVGSTLCSYLLTRYRPRLSLADWPQFQHFVGWSMASQTVSAFNWQADRFILAKFVSQSTLGIFSTAREFAGLSYKVMFDTMQRPVLSALASANFDTARLRRAYIMLVAALLSVGLPIAVGQALVAPELVRLLLGEKWLMAIPAVQAISLTLLPGIFVNLTISLFYATGQPHLVFRRNLQDFLFRIPATIILAWQWGMTGAVIALVAADLFVATLCLFSAGRIAGVSVIEQLVSPWRGIVSTVAMAATVVALRGAVPPTPGIIGSLEFLALAVSAGGVVYAVSHLALWHLAGRPDGIEEVVLRLLRSKLSSRARPSLA